MLRRPRPARCAVEDSLGWIIRAPDHNRPRRTARGRRSGAPLHAFSMPRPIWTRRSGTYFPAASRRRCPHQGPHSVLGTGTNRRAFTHACCSIPPPPVPDRPRRRLLAGIRHHRRIDRRPRHRRGHPRHSRRFRCHKQSRQIGAATISPWGRAASRQGSRISSRTCWTKSRAAGAGMVGCSGAPENRGVEADEVFGETVEPVPVGRIRAALELVSDDLPGEHPVFRLELLDLRHSSHSNPAGRINGRRTPAPGGAGAGRPDSSR